MSDYKRTKIIVKRWVSILTLSLIGSGAAIYATKWVNANATVLNQRWNIAIVFAAVYVFIALPCLYRMGCTGRRTESLKLWIRSQAAFPPSWLAAIPGILASSITWVYLNNAIFPDAWLPIIITAIVTICVSYACTAILKLYDAPKPKFPSSLNSSDLIDSSFWVKIEQPIVKPDQDKFDLLPIAERIAEQLKNSHRSNIALIGSYGTGKSSTANLAEDLLKDEISSGRILSLRISGWGILSEEGAVKHILREIIEKMSSMADISALRGIPDAYRNALSNSDSSLAAIITSFVSPPDPLNLLYQMDSTLRALDCTIVIWLEDLDREAKNERMVRAIEGLLDRFRNQLISNIRFVISIDNGSLIDPYRTCEWDERITIDKEHIRKILETFVTEQHNRFPHDYSLRKKGADKTTSRSSLFPSNPFLALRFHDAKRLPADSLIELLSNPRVIKKVLRRTAAAWELLHGEVRFDDLLLINTLRLTAPATLDFILRNHSKLEVDPREGHGMYGSYNDQEIKNSRESLEQSWKETAQILGDKSQLSLDLVQTLYHDWNVQHYYSHENAPQSLGTEQPTSYLNRCVSERFSGVERDQVLFKAMSNARIDKPDNLLQLLRKSEKYRRIFESFASFQSDAEPALSELNILKLVEHEIDYLLQKYGAVAHFDSEETLATLWRTLCFRHANPSSEWLSRMFDRIVKFSLHLGTDFLYYFGPDRQEGLISRQEYEELLPSYAESIKSVLNNDPATHFIRILDPTRPYTLSHLIKQSWHRYTNDYWKHFLFLGEWILLAAESSPEKLVPQIAMLVSTNNNRDGDPRKPRKVLLNASFIRRFWPKLDDQLRLIRILSSKIDQPSFTSKSIFGSDLSEENIRSMVREIEDTQQLAKQSLKILERG